MKEKRKKNERKMIIPWKSIDLMNNCGRIEKQWQLFEEEEKTQRCIYIELGFKLKSSRFHFFE